MASEPLEVVGAGCEAAVQVEHAGRAARSFPGAVPAGDQDNRPVEALDEARRDDPDHALVPALVREHVAATALLRLWPLLDLGERLAQDPVLDSLPLAVQLLELVCEAARFVLVLGEEELESGSRTAKAARGVDARSESEADGALVDG